VNADGGSLHHQLILMFTELLSVSLQWKSLFVCFFDQKTDFTPSSESLRATTQSSRPSLPPKAWTLKEGVNIVSEITNLVNITTRINWITITNRTKLKIYFWVLSTKVGSNWSGSKLWQESLAM
jgi:hypothetical protein